MESLGQALREMREERGLSLEEASVQSGLNLRGLSALENERFEFFRGNFYFQNYLKNYLEFFRADHEKFFLRFREQIGSVKNGMKEPEAIYFSGIKYSKFSRKGIWIKILLILLIFMALLYFGLYKKGKLSGLIGEKKSIILPRSGMEYDAEKYCDADFSPVNLELKFKGDCWAQILRGNKKFAEKIFRSGEIVRVAGYRILLQMGNPSAAEIYINNKLITKYSDSPEGVILMLNPQSVEDYL